ncbi:hypothetical protein RUM44_005532 [Polyplax serrata]|uniref:Protein KRI1 homolog n=1 Tax=Polyplax serrata TaxID=468196 RepID=A0ABR1AE35_POLSC
MDLLGEDSDADVKFTINKNYAEKYDKWRQGEELQKLKDKFGDTTGSDSSTSEEEDDDGREWTEDVEKNFFKTLSSLKEKNPKIYDKSVRFFDDNHSSIQQKGQGKRDKFYSVAQYERNRLIGSDGKHNNEEVEHDSNLKEMTHVEEEKLLKNSFKTALNDPDSENEGGDGWGTLFKKRVKTEDILKAEEDDYKLWLAGEKAKLKSEEDEKELKGLHDYWTDPSLDKGEQFLRDYILNKRFLENSDKGHVPLYDEIVHDSDSSLSADENTIEKQEEFERKYNFRFEEPDHEFIKRFPRTMEKSMRKKDERRKKHREGVKARKEMEKAKKVEELKRLKALKKKEIMDRIKKLQDITGNETIGFESKDLEGDFDPKEYDKRMSELFNSNYYEECPDEERPEYPGLDEELQIDNWDEWGEEQGHQELHCEDPGFNMDCDYNPTNNQFFEADILRSTKKGKKRKQSKFASAVAKEKPIFDPKDKTFEKYVDEYYALDYEDLIGDLPCRFKYREVVPNDFGLSIEEILAAPDKELNSWVSVKKIMQRRPENMELYDVQAYKRKAQNINKKQKCLPSLYGNRNDYDDVNNFDPTGTDEGANNNLECQGDDNNIQKCKKNGKKNSLKNEELYSHKTKKLTNRKSGNSKCTKFQCEKKNPLENMKLQNKHGRKQKNELSSDLVFNISDARLMSYGINPKKLKNKMKFSMGK